MRKSLLLLVGIAVLWAPAVSFGGDSSSKPAIKSKTPQAKGNLSNPAKSCKSQIYGTNADNGRGADAAAFGKCVSSIAKHKAENDGKDSADSNDKDEGNESAKSHDKTESQGEDTNDQGQDGDNQGQNGDNQGQDTGESHAKNSAHPAKACKTMQTSDLAHFQTAYGARPNAFGRCVSAHAHGRNG